MLPVGASFQPGRQDDERRRIPLTPVQQAVQILSLRLPQILGARAPADRGLLDARAPHVSGLVESILGRVLRGGSTPSGAPGDVRSIAEQAGGGHLIPRFQFQRPGVQPSTPAPPAPTYTPPPPAPMPTAGQTPPGFSGAAYARRGAAPTWSGGSFR